MPVIRTKKVTPEERRIAKAIEEIHNGTLKNITVAAQHHCVPYYKLYYRFYGQIALESNGRLNKALSPMQEKALLLYINRCKEIGRPYKHKHIEIAANCQASRMAVLSGCRNGIVHLRMLCCSLQHEP